MRVPCAWLALPLLAGASAGILPETVPERLILPAAFAALLCAMAGAAFLAQAETHAVLVCVTAGSVLAGWSSGASTAMSLTRAPVLVCVDAHLPESREPLVLEGVLREDAAWVPYGVVVTLDATRCGAGSGPRAVSGGVRLIVGGRPSQADVESWRAGRTLRVVVSLRPPASFRNPGASDEQRASALRGIALAGSIKSASLVEVVHQGTWLEERAAAARAAVRRRLARHVGTHDRRSAAIATAILIGDRTGLSDEDERRLQQAGTYHVIAISGGNIAILTAVLVVGGRVLRVPYRLAATSCIAILLFYGEVAGGAASVGRAITAAVVFLTALLLDRRGAPLNVLAAAALLAVALRPQTPVDGGFLLSFGATMAILLGVPRLVRSSAPARSSVLWRLAASLATAVAGLAAATICAEVALAPVSASLFSRVTFAGILLNFAAIPLMTVVQCGTMALLALASVSTRAADALGLLVHWSASGLVESASLAELAPWLARDVAAPSAWLCAGYYACCAALVALPRWRRAAALGLAICGTALLSGVGAASRAVRAAGPGMLRVVVLDVGQGDATAAILPDGRALLVDAGGLAGTSFEIGSRVVLPALRALGVGELHAVVATHGDPDHVGGAAEVLGALSVGSVWEGVAVPPHPELRALTALAAARRIVWRTVRPGDVERIGGAEVRVFHPPEPEWERQRVRNDDSVVLELRYGGVSIVLPGDIGAEGERALLPRLSLAPLVVLKAAHHGSATSSGDPFLDAVRPGAVIFSTGRHNRFGHPARVVVERFARRGVEMFNTAGDGAVFVETDGTTVEIRGWHSRRRLRLPHR